MPARKRRGLLVIHYHLRPGGVRRVIESLLPFIAEAGRFDRLTILSGGAAEPAWMESLVAACRRRGAALEFLFEEVVGYLGEPPGAAQTVQTIRQRLRAAIETALQGCCGVWVHNLALGRNILLADELRRVSAGKGVAVVNHHHDFFFDGRWGRWPEFVRAGLGTFDEALSALFLDGARVMDVTINRADARLLSNAGGGRAAVWIPNPLVPGRGISDDGFGRVRGWLRDRAGLTGGGPVWLAASRALRRKNLGEAILLTRLFNQGGLLAITGEASSPAERPCIEALQAAAVRCGLPVVFGALAGADAPDISQAIAASDALLLTSLREGFGLSLIEGATARRPQLVRGCGAGLDDLLELGLRLPSLYPDVHIPAGLIDRKAELSRIRARFDAWIENLPEEARQAAERCRPRSIDDRAVAFSRLTLETQTALIQSDPEVLRAEIRDSNTDLFEAVGRLDKPSELSGTALAALQPDILAMTLCDALERAAAHPADSERLRARILERCFVPERIYPPDFDL